MAQHTIFGSTTPAAVQNSDPSSINLATAFYVTSGATWTSTGIRFWLDAASNAPTTGYYGYLSSGPNAQTMTLLTSKAFGTAAKGAWNTLTWDTPQALAVGTKYWVTVYFPGGCYSATGHKFDTAVQATDGSALYAAGTGEVTPGNGAYDYGGQGIMSGAGSFNATWYGVDVITDDGVSGVSHHAAYTVAASRRRYTATLAGRRWHPNPTARRWKGTTLP